MQTNLPHGIVHICKQSKGERKDHKIQMKVNIYLPTFVLSDSQKGAFYCIRSPLYGVQYSVFIYLFIFGGLSTNALYRDKWEEIFRIYMYETM